jgi:hypothetical protein
LPVCCADAPELEKNDGCPHVMDKVLAIGPNALDLGFRRKRMQRRRPAKGCAKLDFAGGIFRPG